MAAKKRSPPRTAEVLIVDDRAEMREMYAEYLAFRGYEVSEAGNGEEALAQCAVRTPAVVVMDLSMPVMDGWEATKRLKTDPRTKAVPVIVVTGHAMGNEMKRAKEVGADAVMAKPALPEQVEAEIAKALAKKRPSTPKRRAAPAPPRAKR